VVKLNSTYIIYGAGIGGNFYFIGTTYDNGDFRDFWCDTFKPIPSNIITNPSWAYGSCGMKIPNELIIKTSGFAIRNAYMPMQRFACK